MKKQVPCPACGYVKNETINYNKAMLNLLKERSNSITLMLKKTMNLIVKYIPSERQSKKMYYFLQAISKISDEKVRYGLTQYLGSKYYMEQKGFAYLKAIITRVGVDSEMKKKYERKRYGTIPKETILR